MNTYKIVFQRYERFESPAPTTMYFKAPNDKLAFLKANPFYAYGCGKMEENPDEEELEELLSIPLEEAIEELHESNGDGFDFLFLLKNEDTGEVIFEDGDYTESDGEVEEWDDEWLGGLSAEDFED